MRRKPGCRAPRGEVQGGGGEEMGDEGTETGGGQGAGVRVEGGEKTERVKLGKIGGVWRSGKKGQGCRGCRPAGAGGGEGGSGVCGALYLLALRLPPLLLPPQGLHVLQPLLLLLLQLPLLPLAPLLLREGRGGLRACPGPSRPSPARTRAPAGRRGRTSRSGHGWGEAAAPDPRGLGSGTPAGRGGRAGCPLPAVRRLGGRLPPAPPASKRAAAQ